MLWFVRNSALRLGVDLAVDKKGKTFESVQSSTIPVKL